MHIPTREHAAALGLAEVWDDAHRLGLTPPRTIETPGNLSNDVANIRGTIHGEVETIGGKVFTDFDSKLEWQFWQRLWASYEAGAWSEVDAHCLKVRAIGDASWFSIDFMGRSHLSGRRIIFETKGYLREKDKLRLVGAASRYPEWQWVIAMRIKRKWECRSITRSGISDEVWCPDWLK